MRRKARHRQALGPLVALDRAAQGGAELPVGRALVFAVLPQGFLKLPELGGIGQDHGLFEDIELGREGEGTDGGVGDALALAPTQHLAVFHLDLGLLVGADIDADDFRSRRRFEQDRRAGRRAARIARVQQDVARVGKVLGDGCPVGIGKVALQPARFGIGEPVRLIVPMIGELEHPPGRRFGDDLLGRHGTNRKSALARGRRKANEGPILGCFDRWPHAEFQPPRQNELRREAVRGAGEPRQAAAGFVVDREQEVRDARKPLSRARIKAMASSGDDIGRHAEGRAHGPCARIHQEPDAVLQVAILRRHGRSVVRAEDRHALDDRRAAHRAARPPGLRRGPVGHRQSQAGERQRDSGQPGSRDANGWPGQAVRHALPPDITNY